MACPRLDGVLWPVGSEMGTEELPVLLLQVQMRLTPTYRVSSCGVALNGAMVSVVCYPTSGFGLEDRFPCRSSELGVRLNIALKSRLKLDRLR